MLVDLSTHEFVRVSGADRHKFLQGQVSCDISQLTPEQSLRGALCNLKGRVIADFRVADTGEDIYLQTLPGMAAVIEGVLKKYAVFSKVDLQVLSEGTVCLGVMGSDSEELLQKLFPTLPQQAHQVVTNDDLLLIRTAGDSARFEIWNLNGRTDTTAELAAHCEPGRAAWLGEEMKAGEIHVLPAMSEEYTPQLLNYDISGVVNFRKGCYTGQEVVARMFYRAQAKKRLYLYRSSVPVDPELATINAGEREFSVLQVNNDSSGGQAEVLLFAVVDVDIVESGEEVVIAAQAEAKLSLLDLPYSVD